MISHKILKRLLNQNVVVHLKLSEVSACHQNLYEEGKACDHFILILEGRVKIYIGKDKFEFEGGPFKYFGVQALIGGWYIMCNLVWFGPTCTLKSKQ